MQASAILDLVRRLLTQEAAENQGQGNLLEAAERVLSKLRAHLSNRIGQEGFRTLVARALTLTTVQFPFLNTVSVAADGLLVGLREAAGSDPQETVAGAVALVTHLLALLVTFIGEELTLRLISTVWPEFPLDDANGGKTEDL